MFTSRAEYRILLRQDNADIRLTEIGHKIGLADEARYAAMIQKKDSTAAAISELNKIRVSADEVNDGLEALNTSTITEKTTLSQLLKRPQISITSLMTLNTNIKNTLEQYSSEVLQQAEVNIKYDSYITREQELVEKLGSLENYKIRPDFNYDLVKALSSESREKLKKIRPETVGQASRISGVSPADVSVLTIYMGK
jgi:tRNA uridine 5-carboxymethylaminomethyl modification enzyme